MSVVSFFSSRNLRASRLREVRPPLEKPNKPLEREQSLGGEKATSFVRDSTSRGSGLHEQVVCFPQKATFTDLSLLATDVTAPVPRRQHTETEEPIAFPPLALRAIWPAILAIGNVPGNFVVRDPLAAKEGRGR